MGVLVNIARLLYLVFEVTKIAFFTIIGKLMPGLEEKKIKWMMSTFRDKEGAESAFKAFKPMKGGGREASFFVFVKQLCFELYNDLFKEVKLNGNALDCNVIELRDIQSGNSLTNLLKFQKRGRPLVLNFGSCT